MVADEADVNVVASMKDIRSQGDLSDYEGEVEVNTTVRVTDRMSGPTADEPATGQDIPFPATVPCTATPDPSVGSTCAMATSFDAIAPGSVPEGQRSIWQLGQVEVNDGGDDGVVATPGNTLFERQGVFVP